MVRLDRNVFGACMVAMGDADAMVTGVTRNWRLAYNNIRYVLDEEKDHLAVGVSMAICRGRTVLIADTAVNERPDARAIADIAIEVAKFARQLGYEPRVAMLAYSNFGYPSGEHSVRIREAVGILDERGVGFEYDGDMSPDVALNAEKMLLYPFSRLSEPANVLIMPGWHSASISTKILQEMGGVTVMGPLLVGLSKSVQIASLGATDTDLVNLAALASYNVER
jgi:malate dehydrogenase (oxaloacetate-decarboxylating)(NADP+)